MRYFKLLFTMGLALLATACEKEPPAAGNQSFTFKARLEQPYNDDDSKVYLDDERWIYWELGDKISIGSDQNNCEGNAENTYSATLVNAGEGDFEHFNGVFVTTMSWGSQYFLGLHPQSDKNIITYSGSGNTFSDIRVELPNVQRLRTDDKQDLTFAKQMLPMVAWYGGEWNSPESAYNLDFHSLGTIVRLQVYNTTGSACTIDSIVITSRDPNRQISGLFKVKDATYKTEDPYLDKDALTLNATTRRITFCNIEDGDRASLGLTLPTSGDDALRSFYLVLPAYKSRHDSTIFHLTMTAYSHDGSTLLSCERNFNVKTRRCGITYLPAIAVNSWTSSPATVVGLTGNGTQERPFKVYSVDDLIKVRNAYNSAVPPAKRYINNIELTNDTYISIMRSDIELTPENGWGSTGTGNTGINNFVGHMTAVSASSNPGVTLKSDIPLFQSISAGAQVEGITVKCDLAFPSIDVVRSPLCYQNYGTIKDCVVRTVEGRNLQATWGNLAGICVNNYGTIEGCRCEASLSVPRNNVAGICYYNQNGAVIRGCQATTMMTVSAPLGNAAGICYDNSGIVEDCYFATRILDNAANWGGIVYDNQQNGVVRNCYISNTAVINTSSTKQVGGIVCNNLGTVNYCWNETSISAGVIGGIVCNMSSGKVVNCYITPRAQLTTSSATGSVAGLVNALSGGSVENSYVNNPTMIRQHSSGVISGLLGAVTGGTVKNCYDREPLHLLFASTENATYTNCYVVDGSQSMAGVTNMTESDANLDAIREALDGFTPWGAEWKHWQQSSANNHTPVLAPYTVGKKRR